MKRLELNLDLAIRLYVVELVIPIPSAPLLVLMVSDVVLNLSTWE